MKSYSWVILLSLGILISGCCPKNICIEKPVVKINCSAPERPMLMPTGKDYDRKIFFKNINTLIEYSELLEGTVECYETGLNQDKK